MGERTHRDAVHTGLGDRADRVERDAATGLGEGPPGHLSLTALAHHALWDAWIHERDVLLPLGIEPPHEADEIAGALRYAAALGPGYGLITGEVRHATLAVVATDPDVAFTVDVGDRIVVHDGADADATARLEGDAVALLEGLSSRGPQPAIDPEHAWLIRSLQVVFDQA